MSIYLSRSFPRSNSSFFLCSGNALQSEVLRLSEEMFLVDAGLGTPRICMQDELTGVPINRATRFENKVGSLDLVAGESLIKEQILKRFFIDLVAGESLIKERATARFNDLVGSTDVVAGEPLLLLPRRLRQNLVWMELNKIWRTKKKVKGLLFRRIKGGFSVYIAGFVAFLPFRFRRLKGRSNNRFTIESIKAKKKKMNIVIKYYRDGLARLLSYRKKDDSSCKIRAGYFSYMLNTCKSNVVLGELGRRKKNLRQRRWQNAFFIERESRGLLRAIL